MLVHNVYFRLADGSPAGVAAQLALAEEHLSGHEGVVALHLGTPAEGLDREVNDRDWHVALTLITLGCSPGGTMSNAMVYLADGDTALSIALTACTNVLALGTMPLLLHLWVERTGAASDIRIPYDSVVLALALVLVPAALGVALRHYRPKLAKIGERIGAGTARNSARNSSARNSSARNSARNSLTRARALALRSSPRTRSSRTSTARRARPSRR